jgi:hypothetical protein
MNIAWSVNGVPVRLTDERWRHIVENHDEIAGHYYEVLETIEEPEFVMVGNRGAFKSVSKKSFQAASC